MEHFTIAVPGMVLDDLRERLGRTRWPHEVDGAGWRYGTDTGYLRDFVRYWREEFSWREQEERLNAFPQYLDRVDGQDIHFIHARSGSPNAFPLVLTHGWPGSFCEFVKVIPLLTDPASHGGDPADAFHVVVPSLPGFGFSGKPTDAFVSQRVPELWVELMARLGYRRFGAHGGDLGAGVTARIGQFYADRVAALHVTMVYGTIGAGDPPPTAAELAYLRQQEEWDLWEGAYQHLQQTRPQTLAHGLTDSPAGLASWIVEKFRAWSDCDGDIESVFTRDDLLTNITLYWVTETIATSFRPYWDFRNNPHPRPWVRVDAPCGVAVFPKDLGRPPREFAERSYNVRHWSEMPRGGHFPALEEPQLLVDDLRGFFREFR